jgi:gas vesicle protein
MKNALKFIAGVMIGALAGSLVILLLTPESGDDTRLAISEKIKFIRSQMMEAAKEKRVELQAEIEKYKNE